MASLNGEGADVERPTSQQSKGRLVLEVTGFLLANKIVVARIHEVQNARLGSPLGTSRPLSVLKAERSNVVHVDDAPEVAGFYVTAIDEVENEYSLYISRQKAEYLYRVENEISDSALTEQISLESMATSILAHLDIIGNRHRDIGKLTCREPQAHVVKKARVVPAKTIATKQKNAHLPTKRLDQRAARSLKTTVKTMEAIALAHQGVHAMDNPTDEEELSPRARKARKSSEYRLLNRMAVADSSTLWKSKLEEIHDDPSFRALMDGINENAETGPRECQPQLSSDEIMANSTSRRAIPEKKTKHKALQERRDKGRNARLRITKATSSSAIHEIVAEPTATETPTCAAGEEIDGIPGNVSDTLPSVANSPSSKQLRGTNAESSPGRMALVGNAYSLKALIADQPHEQEQFLRRRSDASTERRVLKSDNLFSEISGMEIEITSERPSRRGSIAGSSHEGNAVPPEENVRMHENGRRSSFENGNVRRRSSIARSPSRTQLPPFAENVSALASSVSAPELERHEPATHDENSVALSPLKIPTPRRDIRTGLSPRRSAREGEEKDRGEPPKLLENQELFFTTRKFMLDHPQECASSSPRSEVGKQTIAFAEGISQSVASPENLSIQTKLMSHADANESERKTPRTSQVAMKAEQQILEIHEDESEQREEGIAASCAATESCENTLVSDTVSEQAESTALLRSGSSATLSPRQACWGDRLHPREESMPLSSRTLPPVDVATQQTPCDDALDKLHRQDGCETCDLRTRSSDRVQAMEAKQEVDSDGERSINGTTEGLHDQEEKSDVGELRTRSLDRMEPILKAAHAKDIAEDQQQLPDHEEDADSTFAQEDHGDSHVPIDLEHNSAKESVVETEPQRYDEERQAKEELTEADHGEENEEQCDSEADESDRLHGYQKESGIDLHASSIATDTAASPAASPKPSPSDRSPTSKESEEQKKATPMDSRKHSTKSLPSIQPPVEDTSKLPSKKPANPSPANSPSVLSPDTRPSDRRKTSGVSISKGTHDSNDSAARSGRKSVVKSASNAAGDLESDDGKNGEHGDADTGSGMEVKRHISPKKRTSQSAAFLEMSSTYHKKWGKWLNGRHIVDKINCLQLEELVLQNPHNETHLVKLGLRYARWSGTSLAAILLLEHASLVHESALRTHEYWNSMGNAHLDVFLRHRKFLPMCSFHLDRALRAFTRAFAFMESMADPLLLLRYAICLFWRNGESNLEKADDVFHELFTKFATFCDKDRLNLLFLRFQILCRLHMYQEAADCMNTVMNAHSACSVESVRPSSSLSSSRQGAAVPPYDAVDYLVMMMHCQQSSGDYILASATFSSILKAKKITQEGTLSDDHYLELWYSLAEKCFHHEDYTIALEYYSIALNFAKDSQVLASIHYNRGLCYQAIGEDAKCVAEYKRAKNSNRHVVPHVSIAELRASYEDQFALLLQKPIRQVIEEVRVNLYDKAVKKLQRIFRRKQNKHAPSPPSDEAKRNGTPPLKRMASSLDQRGKNPSEAESASRDSLSQHASANGDDGHDGGAVASAAQPESQHHHFLARKKVAQDRIHQIRFDPRYHSQHPLHSPPSKSSGARKANSMPSGSFTHSVILSPDRARPELRRKQSMETFSKVYALRNAGCMCPYL